MTTLVTSSEAGANPFFVNVGAAAVQGIGTGTAALFFTKVSFAAGAISGVTFVLAGGTIGYLCEKLGLEQKIDIISSSSLKRAVKVALLAVQVFISFAVSAVLTTWAGCPITFKAVLILNAKLVVALAVLVLIALTTKACLDLYLTAQSRV
jgi:hypothetical protein